MHSPANVQPASHLISDNLSLATRHSPLSLMIVAGEASGDKHGAALARALQRFHSETEFAFFGAGGEEMRAAGVETLVDAREVAIMGIPEIARSLGKLYRAYRRLLNAARTRQPRVIVLIDWPDFNMRLARKLRREGFKIIYYISPQIWAWRRYRLNALRRDVNKMLVILPFEEAFYQNAGLDVEYVGHPLVEIVRATAQREAFASRHHLDPTKPMLALLPGSRRKEIHYHLPALLNAAAKLWNLRFEFDGRCDELSPPSKASISDAQFIIPLASTVDRQQINQIFQRVNRLPNSAVRFIEDDTYNALAQACFAIVASGTATVEAALLGTPMAIIYRASELNWHLLRPLIHLDTFGMVNLIAGRRIVPELIQHEVTGEKIADAVAAILSSPDRLQQMRDGLAEVCRRLTTEGTPGAERAAQAVMQCIIKDNLMQQSISPERRF